MQSCLSAPLCRAITTANLEAISQGRIYTLNICLVLGPQCFLPLQATQKYGLPCYESCFTVKCQRGSVEIWWEIMGKSGFRIMLYKLRDFARKSPSNPHEAGNNKHFKIERTISLPRSGYYHQFAASSSSEGGAGQGYESPGGPKHKKDEKIPKDKGILLHSKSNRMGRRDKPQLCSTLIETRVSAGCSYRVAVAANARKSLLGKKKKVLKNLQVIEMAKPGDPDCKRNMENLRERNKGIILQSRKEYSDCAAKVSFDGAVQEKRFGFESLRGQAMNGNDNNNNNVERYSGGAVKDGGFEPRKVQHVISNNSGRRCSAFCCSCRLSISESTDGLDESSLLDVDIWSGEEEEEKVEAEHLPTPFVRQSDRVVLDMKIDFSKEDLLETKATLFRPSDVAGHAQVQAKLSRMIEEKGSKKKKEKNARLSNLTSNGEDSQLFPEFHANDDSDNSTLLPGATNDEEFKKGRGNYYARAKIDRQRASLRPKKVEKCRAAANFASSEGNNKISESVAIVKSSHDPRRDFRESMVEMIMENDIRDAQDLKELLHCYIFLNSEEYHDVIFQVFEQVQSDLRIA